MVVEGAGGVGGALGKQRLGCSSLSLFSRLRRHPMLLVNGIMSFRSEDPSPLSAWCELRIRSLTWAAQHI